MKNRNISYFNKARARKIFQNPLGADLTTFLKASFSLSKSTVVKNHVIQSLQNLERRSYNAA